MQASKIRDGPETGPVSGTVSNGEPTLTWTCIDRKSLGTQVNTRLQRKVSSFVYVLSSATTLSLIVFFFTRSSLNRTALCHPWGI